MMDLIPIKISRVAKLNFNKMKPDFLKKNKGFGTCQALIKF